MSRSKMMKTLKTSVLASGFWRLEAPRWYLGALWVSDVRGGKVFRIDLDGKITIVADVPSRPFGLGFLPDGDSLVASMTQRLILRFGADKPTIHADLTEVASGYLRDLAVARDGNAYVTSFDADDSGPDGFASARHLRGRRRRRLGGRRPTVAFCPCATGRAYHTSRSRTGPTCGRVSVGRTRRSDAFLPNGSSQS